MRITGLALALALAAATLPHPSLGADEPLVPPGGWEMNEYCRHRRIGDRDFYMAAQGPWAHISVEGGKALKQVGLYDRVVPGMLKLSSFDADSTDRPVFRKLAKEYVKNGWPFPSCEYTVFQGRPRRKPKSLALARLYLGELLELRVGRARPLLRDDVALEFHEGLVHLGTVVDPGQRLHVIHGIKDIS